MDILCTPPFFHHNYICLQIYGSLRKHYYYTLKKMFIIIRVLKIILRAAVVVDQ